MEKTCKVEGCKGKYFAKGYCNRHYNQIRNHGKIFKTYLDKPSLCQVEGCEIKIKALGYCNKHWLQMKRYGKIYDRTIYDPNEITINNENAYIHLYDKHGIENGMAIIDKEAVERVKKHKWCLDGNGYVKTGSRGSDIWLHNFILKRDPNHEIWCDHKSRNKLDCRKVNLRECNHSQNACNTAIKSNNESGFIGVHFSKWAKKWKVAIRFNNKQYHIGYFVDKIKAAKARDRVAIKMHGEFAVLNFPKEEYP